MGAGSGFQDDKIADESNNEEPMVDLAIPIRHFTHLNHAPGATWTDVTKRKASHKPIPSWI